MNQPALPRTRTGRTWSVVALVVSVTLLAAACGSAKTSTTNAADQAPAAQASDGNLPADEGTPKDGGKVVWGLEAETDSFSPSVGRWALSGHMVASAIFDPLVTVDADGKAVPYLAESITPNAEQTVWTIKLHSGIKFHDGEPLDAAAVVKNLEADKASIITSKAMPWVDTITAADPLTVKITTTQPWATLPNLFASQIGYIAAPSQIDDFHGGDHPIGTGPFVFKEWVKNDHLTATKNPNYWQQGLPHLDEIEYRAVPDAQQRVDQLTDGTLDAIDTVTPSSIDEIRANPDLKRLEYNKGESAFVVLNSSAPPFDNLDARRAVVLATDAAAYINEMGPGVYEPVQRPLRRGQAGVPGRLRLPRLQPRPGQGGGGRLHRHDRQAPPVHLRRRLERRRRQGPAAAQVHVGAGRHPRRPPGRGPGRPGDHRRAGQVPGRRLPPVQPARPRHGLGVDDLDRHRQERRPVAQLRPVLHPRDGRRPRTTAARPPTTTVAGATTRRSPPRSTPAFPSSGWPGSTGSSPSSSRVHGYAEARNGSLQSLGPKTWVAQLWVG